MADIIEATTRNSNLQNQIKGEKVSKSKGVKYVNSQANNNTFATRMPDKREKNHEELNSSQNIATASGVMSID
jgi:hypothetical protein